MPKRGHEPSRLRVVVVGAGIIGASIAYHLSRRNAAVTVVDKAQPGSGASSHSFAWINGTAKSPAAYHDFNRRSLEMWSRFSRQLDADIGLRWGGQLEWGRTAKSAKQLKQRVKQLQQWGYPCRIIDEAELRRLEPGLSPGPVSVATLSYADGQVDPKKVVDACLLRASQAETTLQPDTPVKGLNVAAGSKGGNVESVQTENGSIPCDLVVLASGVETTKLAATAGINVPQQFSPGVVVNTDPHPRLLHNVSVLHTPALNAGHSEIHLRQRADGTVQVGEGSQESLRQDDSLEHAEALLARACQYLPALAGAKALPVPVGFRPMPQDGFPVLGFARAAPNVYIALTHSGVTLAPLIGELAAMEIVDGAAVKALKPYRPERFS